MFKFKILVIIHLCCTIKVFGSSDIVSDLENHRTGKFFPFYTIGRFQNSVCVGANTLQGTCMLGGQCSDNKGINTGSCSTVTNQAVCCVYQRSCGASTSYNNTYWYNNGFPGSDTGGARCAITVTPYSNDICQLRVDFLDFSLAQPTGDGVCLTDYFTVTGGSSRVPRICGENTGSHIYVDFNGGASIVLAVESTGAIKFNRHWHMQIAQIPCDASYRAPSGCLQYYFDDSNTITSFNYRSGPNTQPNAIGVDGSRQLASMRYGICIRPAANRCSITYSQTSNDQYSFTVTGDVGAVDPVLLGSDIVQSQNCNTDYIVIPSPVQDGAQMPSDRFCGLGLVETVSSVRPFVLSVVQDGNENQDIANRGFSIGYDQNQCPIA